MKLNDYQKARKDGFVCAMSLAKALQEAGGTVPSAEDIGQMTVETFITAVAAQNGIRFVCDKPKEVG